MRSALPAVGVLTAGLAVGIVLAACRSGQAPTDAASARGTAEVVHLRGLAFTLPDDESIAWWQRAPSLARLATYAKGGSDVSVGGVSRRMPAAAVSAGFFSVLGIRIIQGRDFEPADDHREPIGSAIVRRTFWKQLGAKDEAIGRAELTVGGRRYQIVGIAPDADLFPRDVDVWIAAPFGSPGFQVLQAPRGAWVARPKPGATMADVESDLYAALASLNTRYAGQGRSFGDTIQVQPLDAETGLASRPAP